MTHCWVISKSASQLLPAEGSTVSACAVKHVPWLVTFQARRHCMATKKLMLHQPGVLHALLQHLTKALITYVCHQIDSGAQVCHHAPAASPPAACGYAAIMHSINSWCPHQHHAVQAVLSSAPLFLACLWQVVQIFDSWAHHLSPADFAEYSMPYAEQVVQGVKAQRPDVPLIFHANGGGGPGC